jgi:hypothetical protein
MKPPYDPNRVQTQRDPGPKDLTGMAFRDVDHLGAFSFCPDSRDASTPATQVHLVVQIKGDLDDYGLRGPKPPPFVCRFHRPEILDALIESLIEHRTYTFGRRAWTADHFPEQPRREYDPTRD